jgi:beta-glucanase (GH16 family)
MNKILIVILLASYYQINAQTWKLIWSDEFDGQSVNTSNWTYETGTGTNGWGNNELQYYTSRPENVTIENGMLVITARQESYSGRNYTSARMKTQGKKSFRFGKIEARMKLPIGQGSWPAFWMLGDNITFVGWPKCGEIDIMEHINSENKVYGTLHWDNNGHVSKGGSTFCDVTQFHVYSIEWNESIIQFFVDGQSYYYQSIANGINSTDEFQNPFFIILNLAIGGNWPGNPDGTMQFPIKMYVDYVKAYELVTDIENMNDEIPQEIKLEQNYPNPFNPETKIKYSVPETEFVSLKVYDILGNEISSLVNETKTPGNYEIKFDGTSLSSGIYLAKLQVGNSFKMRKMILAK